MIPLDYKAAVRRLPLGPCRICSCGGDRVPFLFLSVDSAIHYACPDCEAASWHVERGVHHGLLRSPVDPAWAWVPHTQREAIARYGVLGATPTERGGPPILRVEAVDGAVWVADRAIALRLAVDARYLADVAGAAERSVCVVEPGNGTILRIVTAPGYRPLEVAKDVVPAPAVALVAALYPRAVWSWCSDTAPVLAFDRDRPVAVVMPLARRIATA